MCLTNRASAAARHWILAPAARTWPRRPLQALVSWPRAERELSERRPTSTMAVNRPIRAITEPGQIVPDLFHALRVMTFRAHRHFENSRR